MKKKYLVFLSLAALSVTAAVFLWNPSVETVSSQQRKVVKSDVQTEYVATRQIVFDRESKSLRYPDREELARLVADLKRMTDQSDQNLRRFQLAGGGEGVDLDGRFGGVMLARPRPDGSMETRCVFNFEEGAQFLGLVEAGNDR